MTPTMLWKLAPWALCGVLCLALWGGWGWLQSARKDAQAASQRAESAETKLSAERTRTRELDALLANREAALSKAREQSKKRHKAIDEVKTDECLSLDAPAGDWLDRIFLLPDSGGVPAH